MRRRGSAIRLICERCQVRARREQGGMLLRHGSTYTKAHLGFLSSPVPTFLLVQDSATSSEPTQI